MKKGLIFLTVLVACAGLYIAGRGNPSRLQRAVDSGEILRLHIVAAGDSAYDQETKLIVRDAVLEAFGPRLEDAEDGEAMRGILRDHLAQIEDIARGAARENGYFGEVRASLGNYAFPERTYAKERVPAGQYDALRIVLGGGGGANWWCVMYPPLCFVGEEALEPGEKIEVEFESSIAEWWKKISD